MKTPTAFSILALALLAGRALGQGRPGGPPAPQGSWVIQFKGKVYDQNGALVWNRDQYAASANDNTREVAQGADSNGVPGIGSNDLACVHGTISVRRHWVGSGAPRARTSASTPMRTPLRCSSRTRPPTTASSRRAAML